MPCGAQNRGKKGEKEEEEEEEEEGRDALDRLLSEQPYDVVLCDLMMPEMTGMDLHEEVVRRLPEMAPRMAFLTGGAFTPRAREFLGRIQNPLKPSNAGSVRALVRDFVK